MAEILDYDKRLDSTNEYAKTTEEILNEAINLEIQILPVDIKAIFEMYRIEIIYEPMDKDISGILELRQSGWVAVINQWHHPNRQRFTLAHELGHFLKHRTIKKRFTDNSFFNRLEEKRDKLEIEADQFAADLLMPENEFKNQIEKGNNTLSGISDIFKVSMLAAEIRAKKLKYLR